MRFSLPLALAALVSLVVASARPLAQPREPELDAVRALEGKIARGELRLGTARSDVLRALLGALDIPLDSQVLVFSKTSFQSSLIAPSSPRAIYFNDDTAVGFVQGSGLVEIATTGSDGRLAFYTVDTGTSGAVRVERDGTVCLACHGAAAPGGGLIVANVIPDADGTPLMTTTERLFDITDANTPFERRWGGWYVTGEHGSMRHSGNVHLTDAQPTELDREAGLNVTDLSSRLDLSPYPATTSDIVALMTLEHQLGAMNRIWRTQARGNDQDVDDLVAYLVGAEEAPLPGPVRGVSTFTRTFSARGLRDAQGRSLRDFDLGDRLFRYPLSYVVYSRAFEGMAPALRDRVYRRLFEVLSGEDRSPRFAGLSPDGRQAALEILAATEPDLPAYWRAAAK